MERYGITNLKTVCNVAVVCLRSFDTHPVVISTRGTCSLEVPKVGMASRICDSPGVSKIRGLNPGCGRVLSQRVRGCTLKTIVLGTR